MKRLSLLLTLLLMIANNATAKTIYGFVEKAQLVAHDLTLTAKLDTGAKSASLNATNIKTIEEKGVTFVEFEVPTDKGLVKFKQPYVGEVKIKLRHGERKAKKLQKHFARRPVVEMEVKLGDKQQKIRVNLTNRSRFYYPLLLGRDAIIKFEGIIDPALTFSHKLEP